MNVPHEDPDWNQHDFEHNLNENIMATNPGPWDSGQLPNGNCQGGAPQGWTGGGSQGEPPSSFTTMPYPHQIGGIGKKVGETHFSLEDTCKQNEFFERF